MAIVLFSLRPKMIGSGLVFTKAQKARCFAFGKRLVTARFRTPKDAIAVRFGLNYCAAQSHEEDLGWESIFGRTGLVVLRPVLRPHAALNCCATPHTHARMLGQGL